MYPEGIIIYSPQKKAGHLNIKTNSQSERAPESNLMFRWPVFVTGSIVYFAYNIK